MTHYEKFLRFLQKRFVRHQKFGLSLTIGIMLTIFFAFLFGGILQDYIGHDTLIQADARMANFVYSLRSDTLNDVMLFSTNLGKWQIVFTGVLIAGFLLFALDLLPYLSALVISVVSGEIIIPLIKNLVQRPRPPSIDALVLERGFSFPSGHSFMAFALYGLVAYFIYRTSTKKIWKILSIICGGAVIGAIAFSRVYLGIHWPSDVFASFALGAAWLSLMITIQCF